MQKLNRRFMLIPTFFGLLILILPACSANVENAPPPNPTGFATLEGTVFVVTTDVINSTWNGSGWSISDLPLDTNIQTIPLDCTLYPHAEVHNQWIGGCIGEILVPRNGAEHISVMVSNQDGSMTVYQLAPQPSDTIP
jgi:hypothetical protein